MNVMVAVVVVTSLALTLLTMVVLARSMLMIFPGRVAVVDPFGRRPRILGGGLVYVNPFVEKKIIDLNRPPAIPPGSVGRIVLRIPSMQDYMVVAFDRELVLGHMRANAGTTVEVSLSRELSSIEAVTVRPIRPSSI